MSIAVSAVIRPSRLLRLALCLLAAGCLAAALAIVLLQRDAFHRPLVLACACLCAALAAGHAAVAAPTTRRIDISGLGEIRLLVQHSMGGAGSAAPLLQLQPGSTLWPALLLLLLRDEHGNTATVPILPDSVSAEQFRKIAVGIRAIAGRDNKFFRKHKIL